LPDVINKIVVQQNQIIIIIINDTVIQCPAYNETEWPGITVSEKTYKQMLK